jgi:putative transposase
MYRNTRFNDLLKALPKYSFNKICQQHHADKFSKGFTCWDQLLVMIYAQIHGCRSLRDLETSFNHQSVHHYHLGTRSIKRSTLADANQKRNTDVFAQTCQVLMSKMSRHVRREIKDFLYILDSTPIPLKGQGYEHWTSQNKTYRTQGLKTHVLIEGNTCIPLKMDMTAPNVNDIEWGKTLNIEANATYVFDRGYYDYNWWYRINCKKSTFVTRFKHNAGLLPISTIDIPEEDQGIILSDECVRFKNKKPGGQRVNHYYDTPLRRIVVKLPSRRDPLVIATNDFDRSAKEISEIYRKRWGIELFFKWIKQNLKIKQFLGRSENAVKIQIYSAIIAYLLVYLYRANNGLKFSIREALIILKGGLFQRPEIDQHQISARNRRRSINIRQGCLPI